MAMAMAETRRYLVAGLALGAVGHYASEALFWSFPPNGITLADAAMTVLTYALCAACGLSAVAWTGCGGWRGAFLGGAIAGLLVEGVVVDTMYDAFPVQLVWTPLAWHTLISGLGVLAMGLASGGWRLRHQLAACLGLGLFGGFFASYWPQERPVLPPPEAIILYQLLAGGLVVLGLAVLRRLGHVPRPPPLVALAVPGLALALWLAKSVAAPDPVRLTLPAMLALTLWAMRRLGGGDPRFGPDAAAWRLLPVMIVPVVTAAIAAFLVRGTEGFAANIAAFLVLVPASLCLWLWLLWQAAARRRRSGGRKG